MRIELITQKQSNQLLDLMDKHKALTLQNKGYETISKKDLNDEEKEAIKEIDELLNKHIAGYSYFQNFKLNKEGKPQIRFQYNYGYDGKGTHFIGVGYILFEELLNGFKDE
jgi:hypothetical protein